MLHFLCWLLVLDHMLGFGWKTNWKNLCMGPSGAIFCRRWAISAISKKSFLSSGHRIVQDTKSFRKQKNAPLDEIYLKCGLRFGLSLLVWDPEPRNWFLAWFAPWIGWKWKRSFFWGFRSYCVILNTQIYIKCSPEMT